MGAENGQVYKFDDFILDTREGLLLLRGETVSLPNKAFATLTVLVESHGHLVSKSVLLETVWAGSFVEEGAIARCIWAIRNALGEEPKSARFIQTIPAAVIGSLPPYRYRPTIPKPADCFCRPQRKKAGPSSFWQANGRR